MLDAVFSPFEMYTVLTFAGLLAYLSILPRGCGW